MLTITTTKDLAEIDFPMDLYDAVPIARAVADEETLGTFTICAGLSKERVEDVQRYSLDMQDTDLQKNTSDHERFGQGDYEERYSKKERHSFSLVHDDSHMLASLMWFGPRALPESVRVDDADDKQWDTIAMRTYGVFRGVGITSDFSAYILNAYCQRFPEHKIWLAAKDDYQPALKLYHKLGFRETGAKDDAGKIIMILEEASGSSGKK